MSGIFKNLGVVLVTAFSFEASAQAASTTVDL